MTKEEAMAQAVNAFQIAVNDELTPRLDIQPYSSSFVVSFDSGDILKAVKLSLKVEPLLQSEMVGSPGAFIIACYNFPYDDSVTEK